MNILKRSLLISTTLLLGLQNGHAMEELGAEGDSLKASQGFKNTMPSSEGFDDIDKYNLSSIWNDWESTDPLSLVKENDQGAIKIFPGYSAALVFKTLKTKKPYFFKVFENPDESTSDSKNESKYSLTNQVETSDLKASSSGSIRAVDNEYDETEGVLIQFKSKKYKFRQEIAASGIRLAHLVGQCTPEKFLNKTKPRVLIFEEAPGKPIHGIFLDFLRDVSITKDFLSCDTEETEKAIVNVARQMAVFHNIMREKGKDLTSRYDVWLTEKGEKVSKGSDKKNNLATKHIFESTLNLFNREYRHKDVDNILSKILSVTHGDAHSENIFFHSESGQVTFIDYWKMHKTSSGFDNPCQDMGRFLGSLWFAAAKTFLGRTLKEDSDLEKAKHVIKELKAFEKKFLDTYIQNIGVKFSAQEHEVLEKLIYIGTDFYKLELYATKLEMDNLGKEAERKEIREFLGKLHLLQYCEQDVLFKCVAGAPNTGKCLNVDKHTGSVRVDKDQLYSIENPENYYWRMNPHMLGEHLVFSLKSSSSNRYLTLNPEGDKKLENEDKKTYWQLSSENRVNETFKITEYGANGRVLYASGGGMSGLGDHWQVITSKHFKWSKEKDKLDESHLVNSQSQDFINAELMGEPIRELCGRDVIFEWHSEKQMCPQYLWGDAFRGYRYIDNDASILFNENTPPHQGFHWMIVPVGFNMFHIERLSSGKRKYLGFHDGKVFLNEIQTMSTLWKFKPKDREQGWFAVKSCSPFAKQSGKKYLDAKVYGQLGGSLILSNTEVPWRIRVWNLFANQGGTGNDILAPSALAEQSSESAKWQHSNIQPVGEPSSINNSSLGFSGAFDQRSPSTLVLQGRETRNVRLECFFLNNPNQFVWGNRTAPGGAKIRKNDKKEGFNWIINFASINNETTYCTLERPPEIGKNKDKFLYLGIENGEVILQETKYHDNSITLWQIIPTTPNQEVYYRIMCWENKHSPKCIYLSGAPWNNEPGCLSLKEDFDPETCTWRIHDRP